jgi:hypothetical protein
MSLSIESLSNVAKAVLLARLAHATEAPSLQLPSCFQKLQTASHAMATAIA